MNTKRPICVVIYDGQCAFCRAQVARIRRWDRDLQFEYVSSHEPLLTTRFPILSDEDFKTGMRLITPDGCVHVGADAVYQIMRRIPLGKCAAWMYRVPGASFFAKGAYALIAKNRHRLAKRCNDGLCEVVQKH